MVSVPPTQWTKVVSSSLMETDSAPQTGHRNTPKELTPFDEPEPDRDGSVSPHAKILSPDSIEMAQTKDSTDLMGSSPSSDTFIRDNDDSETSSPQDSGLHRKSEHKTSSKVSFEQSSGSIIYSSES